jgi:hypothetical protein
MQRFLGRSDRCCCCKRLQIAAVVDLLNDRKPWKLDEVDIAEREFEEDPAHGPAVQNADLLPCSVDHTVGKARPGKGRPGIP